MEGHLLSSPPPLGHSQQRQCWWLNPAVPRPGLRDSHPISWGWAALPSSFLALFLLIQRTHLSSNPGLLLPYFHTHGFCLGEPELAESYTDTLWSGLSVCWQMLPSSRSLFSGPDIEPVPRCLGAEPGWSFSWAASGCLAGHGRQLSASDKLRLSLWSGVAELTTGADLLTCLSCCVLMRELVALCVWHRIIAWGRILYSAFPALDFNMFYANQTFFLCVL